MICGNAKFSLAKSLQTNVFPVGKKSLLERRITWKTHAMNRQNYMRTTHQEYVKFSLSLKAPNIEKKRGSSPIEWMLQKPCGKGSGPSAQKTHLSAHIPRDEIAHWDPLSTNTG